MKWYYVNFNRGGCGGWGCPGAELVYMVAANNPDEAVETVRQHHQVDEYDYLKAVKELVLPDLSRKKKPYVFP